MKKRSNSNAKSGSSPLICYRSLEIDGRRYLIQRVDVHTKTRFEAGGRRYYIHVYNPEISFGTVYDGWADEEIDNLDDAIKEALK